jgi:hypothetical protein
MTISETQIIIELAHLPVSTTCYDSTAIDLDADCVMRTSGNSELAKSSSIACEESISSLSQISQVFSCSNLASIRDGAFSPAVTWDQLGMALTGSLRRTVRN